jgi:hypothetical protein
MKRSYCSPAVLEAFLDLLAKQIGPGVDSGEPAFDTVVPLWFDLVGILQRPNSQTQIVVPVVVALERRPPLWVEATKGY